tara:strand:- start:248 stop:430 length:183 start_codon:yes stop_codon:yes gene_type:complete
MSPVLRIYKTMNTTPCHAVQKWVLFVQNKYKHGPFLLYDSFRPIEKITLRDLSKTPVLAE